jgi:hypothetical protein
MLYGCKANLEAHLQDWQSNCNMYLDGPVHSNYCPELPINQIPTGTHTLSYSVPHGSPAPFAPTTFVVAKNAAAGTLLATSVVHPSTATATITVMVLICSCSRVALAEPYTYPNLKSLLLKSTRLRIRAVGRSSACYPWLH